jgi:hypothetical protein
MLKHEDSLSALLIFDTGILCHQVQLELHSFAYDWIIAEEEEVGINHHGEENFLVEYWI